MGQGGGGGETGSHHCFRKLLCGRAELLQKSKWDCRQAGPQGLSEQLSPSHSPGKLGGRSWGPRQLTYGEQGEGGGGEVEEVNQGVGEGSRHPGL